MKPGVDIAASEIAEVLQAAQGIAEQAMSRAVRGVLNAQREQLLRDLRSIPRIGAFEDRYQKGRFDALRAQLTKLDRCIEAAERQWRKASAGGALMGRGE
jgi:hypothetical protein